MDTVDQFWSSLRSCCNIIREWHPQISLSIQLLCPWWYSGQPRQQSIQFVFISWGLARVLHSELQSRNSNGWMAPYLISARRRASDVSCIYLAYPHLSVCLLVSPQPSGIFRLLPTSQCLALLYIPISNAQGEWLPCTWRTNLICE